MYTFSPLPVISLIIFIFTYIVVDVWKVAVQEKLYDDNGPYIEIYKSLSVIATFAIVSLNVINKSLFDITLSVAVGINWFSIHISIVVGLPPLQI